jgi:hypothetical protein
MKSGMDLIVDSRYIIKMKSKSKLFCALFSCCIVSVPAVAEEAVDEVPTVGEKKFYKTIGPDGEVIYTDKPVQDGKEINVPKASTYEPVPTPSFQASKPAPKKKPFEYDALAISKPAHEETIWSNEGKLEVNINLQPSLRNNHSIAVSVDGNRLKSGEGQAYQLSGIHPGEHQLKVEIVDSDGTVIKSHASTFFMRRHTIKR